MTTPTQRIALNAEMKPKQEIWICCHTRKCGWRGQNSELSSVRDKEGRFALPSWTSVCPKCGGKEFYVRDINEITYGPS